MRCRVLPTLLIEFALCALCCGCGGQADTLPGRVAIEVTVRIDSQPVGDGNLVLRPDPGVKCPLIKVPVTAGIGRRDTSNGPVPGSYQATYLPDGAGRNITEQLTETGRVKPTAAGGALKASRSGDVGILVPNAAISITVPDGNPAKFFADFEASRK